MAVSLAKPLMESPLARATYREWRPAHLAGLVELLWYYGGPTMHTRKRIFPNGRVELLVNLGEPYRTIRMIMSVWVPAAISAAATLGLPDHLGEGPKRSDDVAKAAGANPGSGPEAPPRSRRPRALHRDGRRCLPAHADGQLPALRRTRLDA